MYGIYACLGMLSRSTLPRGRKTKTQFDRASCALQGGGRKQSTGFFQLHYERGTMVVPMLSSDPKTRVTRTRRAQSFVFVYRGPRGRSPTIVCLREAGGNQHASKRDLLDKCVKDTIRTNNRCHDQPDIYRSDRFFFQYYQSSSARSYSYVFLYISHSHPTRYGCLRFLVV